MHYKNFDIAILSGQDGKQFLIYATSESQGEATSRLKFDPKSEAILSCLKKIDEARATPEELKSFGSQLYDGIFTDDVKQLWERSFGEVAAQSNCGLRLRLRIEAPELAALPWEFLYSPLRQQFLAASNETPLVRYLNLPEPKKSLAILGLAKVLVLIPELWGIDVEREKQILQKAWAHVKKPIIVDYLEGEVTPARVRTALNQQKYHLVHYIGHGEFNQQEALIYLNTEDGRSFPLNDEKFGAFFTKNLSTRLVVLNACQGGKQSSSRALAGMAPQLVNRGLPAVVAMQYPINDSDAILFAQEFYGQLCSSNHSGLVDMAISRARNALWQESQCAHALGIPVLFMRSNNGHLWEHPSEADRTIAVKNEINKYRRQKGGGASRSNIVLKVTPSFLLIIILIVLSSVRKEQQVLIEAITKKFSLQTGVQANVSTTLPLLIKEAALIGSGQLQLALKELKSVGAARSIIYRRSNSPYHVTISPSTSVKKYEMHIEGDEARFRLTPFKIPSDYLIKLGTAEDYSIKLDFFNPKQSVTIQLSDTLKVRLEKCHLRIFTDTIDTTYTIDEQSVFTMIINSDESLLKVTELESATFIVPSNCFGNNTVLLKEPVAVNNINFEKKELGKMESSSGLVYFRVEFEGMPGSPYILDESTVYIKPVFFQNGYLLNWNFLKRGVNNDSLFFQIKLSGLSKKIEVGMTKKSLKNIMPTILEWLWEQKRIVIISTCLLWLLSTHIALWGLLKRH